MKVASQKLLREFIDSHPKSKTLVRNWFDIIESRDFYSYEDLKDVFKSVPMAGPHYAFGLGKKYWVIAELAPAVTLRLKFSKS